MRGDFLFYFVKQCTSDDELCIVTYMNNTAHTTIKLTFELEWEGGWFHDFVDFEGLFVSHRKFADHDKYVVEISNLEEFARIAKLYNATII